MRAELRGAEHRSTPTQVRSRASQAPPKPSELAAEVATVLAAMSYEERVRAYRSGAISPHELSVAAGWFPEEMPMLNREYEWIAIDLE